MGAVAGDLLQWGGRRVISRSVLETAFRSFPYAVAVVLSGRDGAAASMVATWAMQVSFTPSLVALALETGSRMKGKVEESGSFSINFFSAGSVAVVKPFLKSPSSAGDSIGGCPLAWAGEGVPVLPDAAVSLACRLTAMHGAGDHVICIGEVVAADVRREGDVLSLKETGWKYYR